MTGTARGRAEWGAVLDDDILATAILDRLLHHCEVIGVDGLTFRLRSRTNLIPGSDPEPDMAS